MLTRALMCIINTDATAATAPALVYKYSFDSSKLQLSRWPRPVPTVAPPPKTPVQQPSSELPLTVVSLNIHLTG